MALITIDGVDLPTPSDYSVGIMDISKAERNARGRLIIERITTKRKIEISYSFLTGNELSQVLQAVSPVSYPVTYLDPQTGSNRTANFYSGDRNVGMLDFTDGVPRYKDVKFDLVEL